MTVLKLLREYSTTFNVIFVAIRINIIIPSGHIFSCYFHPYSVLHYLSRSWWEYQTKKAPDLLGSRLKCPVLKCKVGVSLNERKKSELRNECRLHNQGDHSEVKHTVNLPVEMIDYLI